MAHEYGEWRSTGSSTLPGTRSPFEEQERQTFTQWRRETPGGGEENILLPVGQNPNESLEGARQRDFGRASTPVEREQQRRAADVQAGKERKEGRERAQRIAENRQVAVEFEGERFEPKSKAAGPAAPGGGFSFAGTFDNPLQVSPGFASKLKGAAVAGGVQASVKGEAGAEGEAYRFARVEDGRVAQAFVSGYRSGGETAQEARLRAFEGEKAGLGSFLPLRLREAVADPSSALGQQRSVAGTQIPYSYLPKELALGVGDAVRGGVEVLLSPFTAVALAGIAAGEARNLGFGAGDQLRIGAAAGGSYLAELGVALVTFPSKVAKGETGLSVPRQLAAIGTGFALGGAGKVGRAPTYAVTKATGRGFLVEGVRPVGGVKEVFVERTSKLFLETETKASKVKAQPVEGLVFGGKVKGALLVEKPSPGALVMRGPISETFSIPGKVKPYTFSAAKSSGRRARASAEAVGDQAARRVGADPVVIKKGAFGIITTPATVVPAFEKTTLVKGGATMRSFTGGTGKGVAELVATQRFDVLPKAAPGGFRQVSIVEGVITDVIRAPRKAAHAGRIRPLKLVPPRLFSGNVNIKLLGPGRAKITFARRSDGKSITKLVSFQQPQPVSAVLDVQTLSQPKSTASPVAFFTGATSGAFQSDALERAYGVKTESLAFVEPPTYEKISSSPLATRQQTRLSILSFPSVRVLQAALQAQKSGVVLRLATLTRSRQRSALGLLSLQQTAQRPVISVRSDVRQAIRTAVAVRSVSRTRQITTQIPKFGFEVPTIPKGLFLLPGIKETRFNSPFKIAGKRQGKQPLAGTPSFIALGLKVRGKRKDLLGSFTGLEIRPTIGTRGFPL